MAKHVEEESLEYLKDRAETYIKKTFGGNAQVQELKMLNKNYERIKYKVKANKPKPKIFKIPTPENFINIKENLLVSPAISITGGLITFRWPVGSHSIKLKPPSKYLDPEPLIITNKPYRKIEPLKERYLISDFLKVDPEDDNSILAFVDKYGLLGYLNDSNSNRFEEVYYFQRAVEHFKEIYGLFHLIEQGRIDQALKAHFSNLLLEKPNALDFLSSRSLKEKADYAKYCLVSDIARALEGGTSFTAYSSDEGESRIGFELKTLLGAIYLQFYFVVIERYRYVECPKCNRLYTSLRKPKKDLCPRCNNSERQAKFRIPNNGQKKAKAKKGR